MSNITIIFLYIILFIVKFIQTKKVSLYAFTYTNSDSYYSAIVDKFNEYSQKNSLGIILELKFLGNSGSNLTPEEVAKKLTNYLKDSQNNENPENIDIVTYELMYSSKFSEYFIDLKKYFSKERIETYIRSSIESCSTMKRELVALPLFSEYGVLGYNADLLKKYNKSIPKTWNELIETAKYIIDSEKAIGKNIIGYASQHIETETATCSALELLYSGRKKKTDRCPSLKSDEALKVMGILKEMKEKGVATVDSLNKTEGEIAEGLWSGKILFGRNWQFVGTVCNDENIVKFNPLCNALIKSTILPGYYEGISASVVGGHNIAVPKTSKNIEEAVKVIDFLTNYTIQKEFVNEKLPAIPEIYYDQEVCQQIDCSLYSAIQAIARPSSFKEYDQYSFEFRDNISKAVKDEISFDIALIRNRNIISIKNTEFKSWPSIVINGIALILLIGCFISIFFVYSYSDNEHLCFMNINYWYTYIIGCLFILIYVVLTSGNTSNLKCQFRFWILMLGYSLCNVPIFARLMGNYPRNYGLPKFVRNNMTMVTNFLLFMEMGIAFLWAVFSPFKRRVIRTNNELNEAYYICDSDSFIGDFYFNFSVAINLFMTLGIAYLMFIEWRFPKYYLDLRNFSFIIYSSIVFLIVEVVLKYIPVRDIILYYFLHTIPKLFYVFYLTIVIFSLKFYYICKDIPAEKKTICSIKDKFSSSDHYEYQIIPEDNYESYTNTLTNKSNYCSPITKSTKITNPSPQIRSTTIDVMNNKYSDSTLNTSKEKKFNTPNPDNIPTIISNSFQYPESIFPSGNTDILMYGGKYNYMNVENLLHIMKN